MANSILVKLNLLLQYKMNITKYNSFELKLKPKYTLSSWSGKEDDTVHLQFTDTLEKSM